MFLFTNGKVSLGTRLNAPQVNDIIYFDACACDNSSKGALFLAAFEAKQNMFFSSRYHVVIGYETPQ
jgi:hypothetical protein